MLKRPWENNNIILRLSNHWLCYYTYPEAKGSVPFSSTTFNFSLGEILQFTTGMPYEPPLGYIPQPSVAFTSFSLFRLPIRVAM